jgi:asparagine synthase (glutamine-hydrolysing)
VQTHWQAYVASLDQPIGDSASFLTWLLAKEASDNCKVLISGAGADELFGGYNRHIAYKYYLQYPNLWLNLKKMGLIHLLPERISKFLDCIHHDREETFIQMAALENIPKALMEKIKPYYPKGKGAIINALEWDRTWYLVNDILKVHDNACMTHGVEGRSPYLDQDLITLSQSMTEEEHLQQLGKKWIKSELQKRNLGIIANRKKLGFGLPLKEWLQQKDFRNWVFEPIEKMGQNWGQNFPEEMRNLALNPTKAKDRQYLQIWNLFILASWIAHKSP